MRRWGGLWSRSLRLSLAGLATCASALVLLAQDAPTLMPLVQIGPKLYQTEHCLYLVEDDGRVAWPDASSVFSQANLERYFTILTTQFPGVYDSVCFLATNLTPKDAPVYVTRKFKASGINSPGTPGAPQSFASVDYCAFDIEEDSVSFDSLRVYDREIGHAWGVNVLNQNAGHWWDASTVDCKLGGGTLVAPLRSNKIYGDPVSGFRWRGIDSRQSDHQQTFSEQQLYLMGLHPTLPAFHAFGSPVFNADHTLGYLSVTAYDQATLSAEAGPRSPDYKQSPKQFKVAFVYIARDQAEIYNNTFRWTELAIMRYGESEDLAWGGDYDGLVPFLCGTRYRASIDCVLADLDGNRRPTLTVTDTYVASTDGTATVRFAASDPDGPAPTVSVLPYSGSCTIQGNTVQIAGLPEGVHFFTLRAQDTAGKLPFGYAIRGAKKAFGHFVVEVKRASSAVSFTAQPADRTVTACATATFTVVASGSPLNYQWFLQAAGTSTWNPVNDGSGYAGDTTATLAVTTSVTMDGDRFLCVASNGAATSAVATLTVREQAPLAELSSSQLASGFRIGEDWEPVCFNVFWGRAPEVTGYCTFQWQCRPATAASWSDLVDTDFVTTGAKTAQLRVWVRAMEQNGDRYRCVVTNTAGSVTSPEEALRVRVLPVATVNPGQLTVSAGESATFKVSATGTPPFTYQWYRAGQPIPGATTDTLSFANLAGNEGGLYTVVVKNTAESTPAVCYLDLHIPLPVITAAPVDRTVAPGATASFSIGATSFGFPGFGFLNFMWERKPAGVGAWAPVDNQFRVTPALAITDTTLAMNGDQFRCVVASQEGWSYSPVATLTVAAPQPPSITAQPTVSAVVVGSPAMLSVAATGTGSLAYQWQRKPAATGIWGNLASGAQFTGTTTATLVIGSVDPAMKRDQYRCVVTSSLGAVTSFVVGLRGGADFDGNGSPDILWTQVSTGRRVIWTMTGTSRTSLTSAVELGTIPPDWVINGVADFDGNGSPDILWTQVSTGRRVIWTMNGTVRTSNTAAVELGTIPTDWVINGAGDFDGNGSPDILWTQASTGRRVIWLMNGTARTSSTSVVELGTIPTDWVINGAADFDGNGTPDILWTQASTGRRVLWTMNGTARTSNTAVVELGTIPPDWMIDGTGDFDGNGSPDILWTQASTGRRVLWLMNGTARMSNTAVELGTIPTDWRICNH